MKQSDKDKITKLQIELWVSDYRDKAKHEEIKTKIHNLSVLSQSKET